MLKDKVVIITGGTRGIGLETARTFAQNGAKVIIFGSREETVTKAIGTLKSEQLEATGFWPNLDDYQSIQEAISQIVAEHGRIDILVNNAGISASKIGRAHV